ncbi:hypothetical protein LCGC14_2203450 [marine sediment metagenome]|uniref:Uncharacterized protein n=1 Tax=marine sediment metagenome TaxID=412755 RepID=A0A0F9E3C2_9ZZZZ
MGLLAQVVIIVYVINAFLIIGTGANVAQDAISNLITIEGQQVGINETAQTNIPTTVKTNTVETGTTGFNFVDVLRTPFNVFTTIMSFLLAPINIANELDIPLALNLLIMAPITILFYVSIGVWIRGGGGG